MKNLFFALATCFSLAISLSAAEQPLDKANPEKKANAEKRSGIELDQVSSTLKPGSNFYEYANEGWLQNTKIPADQSNYGSFSKLDDGAKEAIRKLIEEAAAETGAAGQRLTKGGRFFQELHQPGLAESAGYPAHSTPAGRNYRRPPTAKAWPRS